MNEPGVPPGRSMMTGTSRPTQLFAMSSVQESTVPVADALEDKSNSVFVGDTTLPPGAQPVFSDPDAGSLDELYRNLGGHVLWHNLRELGRTLERRGVRFSLLEDERLSAGLVSRYLDVKRRQLL